MAVTVDVAVYVGVGYNGNVIVDVVTVDGVTVIL